MDDNLLGYLLGSLDDAGNRHVEAYVHGSPDASRKLAVLKKALRPLAADRDDSVPPVGLAERTLARIAGQAGWDLPRAPRDTAVPATSRGNWWLRRDVLVATTLLVLALGAVSPLIYHWQRQRG